MAEQMEILLKTDRKPEAEEVLRLLEEMTPTEQQEMLIFMKAARWVREMDRKKAIQTV